MAAALAAFGSRRTGRTLSSLCLATLLLLALLLVSLGSISCQTGSSAAVETITIGVPPLEQNALLYVAESQGYFAPNGLSVAIKDYDSGVTAIDAMIRGEVDIAEAAEFPFIGAALRKAPVRIFAGNDKFENDYILARKDLGITQPAQLKGKRIGVTLQTINEFYLGRFLELNGLSIKDVTLVDTRPAQFAGAIASGNVDALVAWQPFVSQILEKDEDAVSAWPVQSNQAVYGVLVARTDWLKSHSAAATRFLKALAQAEDYAANHPTEARAIVQKRLRYTDDYVAAVWPQHQFSLSLEQGLVVAMRDEAEWMIRNNLVSEKSTPDFVDHIYVDALQSVKPRAVSVIR